MEGNKRVYLPSVDGLRAVACALVFIGHFPFRDTNPFGFIAAYGWAGVDLFFVISAFLLTVLRPA